MRKPNHDDDREADDAPQHLAWFFGPFFQKSIRMIRSPLNAWKTMAATSPVFQDGHDRVLVRGHDGVIGPGRYPDQRGVEYVYQEEEKD